jgi:hypothetical protein
LILTRIKHLPDIGHIYQYNRRPSGTQATRRAKRPASAFIIGYKAGL